MVAYYISVDQFVFGSFVYEICEDMENNPVTNGLDIHCVFLWGNLSVYKTAYVARLIREHDTHVIFEVVSRPLYMPKISLVEYLIFKLMAELDKQVKHRLTIKSLKYYIRDVVIGLGTRSSFHNTLGSDSAFELELRDVADHSYLFRFSVYYMCFHILKIYSSSNDLYSASSVPVELVCTVV